MELVRGIYATTREWPRDELFGLTGHVRCAAVSVPANVAEGKGRTGNREYLHHVSIAHGSLWEVETHLQIAHDPDDLNQPTLDALLDRTAEVSRLLQGLNRSLR